MTLSRLLSLISIPASLTLALACAAPMVEEGDLPIEEGDDGLAKADSVSLSLSRLDFADVSLARRQKGGKAILTSANAWKKYLGTQAPTDIDFSKEWVAFYGSGVKNSGGFSAEILGIRYDAQTRGLVLETKAISPDKDCVVTAVITTPHTVVKFEIPKPRPEFAVSMHEDEVQRCGLTNEERLEELEDSRAKLEAAKADSGNSYTYTRLHSSAFAASMRTIFVVDNGVVVERHFKVESTTVWSEIGSEVGSHKDEGHPVLLLDDLYDECKNDVLTQDEDENFVDLAFHPDGLLLACTYFPRECADDCSRGPVITSIEMK